MYGLRCFVFCDMQLSPQDIAAITDMLGAPSETSEASTFWNIRDEKTGRILALTISQIAVEGSDGMLVVSAQTHQGYVELHDITAYLCIEPDEVMFVAKQGDRFSSLVVGKTCTCSQFGNVQASLIKGDLTELDPALLMAAMQSSLAESLLETP
jgi:hypothetical protein